MRVHGAAGTMTLLSEMDDASERETRVLRLEASIDGRTVVMTEIDHRKPGVRREISYEITAAELIAVIRAHGTVVDWESRCP
ncbi:hypothetical protein R75465_07918 [Paraburkholderia aspalathi]|uniref:hypothetical protein n=1 Tax=Paraburkholderia aspalathi TaxID=1324617 RepID=UPI001AFE95CD|nr:hypothetical protein [Paraburkholderia aspalathi]CAE6865421.1 hypothetical protein R75465_07918 [Paraburkholderia aspalathi]